MSMIPCRKAAWRIVSSSSTSISMPTGWKRTVCVFPMARVGWGSRRAPPAPPAGRSGRGRRTACRPAALVLGHVALALLGRHLVQEHVRAVERDALDLVQGPHLLGIEVEVRLRDQRVPVVADVAEVVAHDLGEVVTVVERLPLALAGETAHRRCRPALVLGPEGDLVGPV